MQKPTCIGYTSIIQNYALQIGTILAHNCNNRVIALLGQGKNLQSSQILEDVAKNTLCYN